MIEFNLSSICELQRRLDYNYNHGKDGRFTSAKGAGRKTSNPKGRKRKKSLPMTGKEKAKVAHDINKVYYANYKGRIYCTIETNANEIDSPLQRYFFINRGFNNYHIYFKEDYD